MQIKNNYYDYAKKYKNIIRYFVFAIPLILLLLAFVFPIKQINNTYELENTTTEETTTTINFNQLLNEGTINLMPQTFTLIPIVYNQNEYFNLKFDYSVNKNESIYMYIGFWSNDMTSFTRNYYPNSYIMENDNIQIYGNSFKNTSGTLIYGNMLLVIQYWNTINEQEPLVITNLQYNNITNFDFETIPSKDVFNALFPLDYYAYNSSQEITLNTLTITNNIGNQAGQPLQSNENREVNTAFLEPLNEFYDLSINEWYRDTLNYMNLTSDNVVTNYLLYYPLWILIVLILDIILDFVLIVPCLVHRIANKFKGDD